MLKSYKSSYSYKYTLYITMNSSIKSIIHGAFLTTDYRDYRPDTTNIQKSRNHPKIISLRKSIFLNTALFSNAYNSTVYYLSTKYQNGSLILQLYKSILICIDMLSGGTGWAPVAILPRLRSKLFLLILWLQS